MTHDLRGFWRGKMNVNFYESFFFQYQHLPQYAGAPVNNPGAPTISFDLKISTYVDYFGERFSSGTLIVLSGEAGHYTGPYGDSGQITLPVNGYFLDDSFQTVHLTFLNLVTRRPANFLGRLADDRHIVGDWTEARQWNEWTDAAGRNYDSFNFGKMTLQKMISFKDRADVVTATHLFSP